MEKDEARKLLSFHSGRNSDIHDPRWKNGFLGCLRPFCGELREENFIEVMGTWQTAQGYWVTIVRKLNTSTPKLPKTGY